MSAVTTDVSLIQRNPEFKIEWNAPMKASTQLWTGTICMLNSSGYVITGADTASSTFAGIGKETKLSSTGDGSSNILLFRAGVFWFRHTGLTVADAGAQACISDNQTVTNAATATNDVKCGQILELETIAGVAGVWVAFGLATMV